MQKLKDKVKKKFVEKTISKESAKVDSVISKQPHGTTDDDSSHEKDSSRGKKKKFNKLAKLKGKFSRTSSKSKGSSGSEETHSDTSPKDNEESSGSENENELGDFKPAAKDKNFGKTSFVDPSTPGTWNILVRVIEGRDLASGALRVRASLDGRQKATRACSEGLPTWRQNLCFVKMDTSLEKLASELLTIKLTRVGRLMEHPVGEWGVALAAVLHSSQRAVISKWIALRQPGDDEELDGQHCGFIKVSLCVYGSNDSPPHMNDDDDNEEVWSGAQLEEHTLRIRLFRLHQIAEQLLAEAAKKETKKKHITFFIRIRVGSAIMDSSAEQRMVYDMGECQSDVVHLEQEVFIPILWPTVIDKIVFELFMKRGKRKRCIGQATIPLRSIYEPGEEGFMPVFGPSFVNFYGHEVLQRLKFRKEKRSIKEGTGSKFMARLLCSVDGVEYMGESSQRSQLSHSSLEYSKNFESMHRYSAFCTFYACNMINPLFASSNVSFHVSMGEFGSTSAQSNNIRSCTFGAMPDTDKHKYFFMPWGNHKPMAEVFCSWENIEARLWRSNTISKVCSMLQSMTSFVKCVSPMNGDEAASFAIEAMDNMEEMLDRLEKYEISRHQRKSDTTELDQSWEKIRKRTLRKISKELNNIRFELSQSYEETPEKVTRLLLRLKNSLERVASDAQISIPCITIKMIANKKVVGYSKIDPAEVFYNPNDALCGEYCGKMRAVQVKWPSLLDRKNRREEFVANLHVVMWFGRRDDVSAWEESVRPAEMKSFLEVFTHQRRSKLNRQWKVWNGFPYSDESGRTNMECTIRRETFGWKHLGNWVCRSSHDMWISADSSRPRAVDRAYEVEQKKGDDWEFVKYTDYFGGEIEKMKEAPRGWEYVGKWTVDHHLNNGDSRGWQYAIDEVFWGENGTVDKEKRACHNFRRRCVTRERNAQNYSTQNEDFDTYSNSLNDLKWEFAGSFEKAWHHDEVADASVRRRRFLVEVERQSNIPVGREHECFFLSRMFEVHNTSSIWQLRCYLLWAKDLLPVVKTSSCAFARVTFLTRARQSLIVANSQNPVWCETLIFDQMPIPGGKRQIALNPPSILVEVRGERSDDSEMFLGRFEVNPTVITSPADSRAQPQWHTLNFHNGKTRGAVLASFELFHVDPRHQDQLPLQPMRKSNNNDRFEVPTEMRPKFDKYAVQVMCWGVRNVSRHKLLSVRRPFLELLIGDCELRTEALKNSSKDPNFPEPLISFPEVQLPSALELSPPLVMNLYDTRAFNRQPLLGVCHISNFTKYIRNEKVKKTSSEKSTWAAFEKVIEEENFILANTNIQTSIQREGQPRIDWWSKYYASQGMHSKAPGFEESGMEHLTVFKWDLGEVNGYNHFTDFLDTFTFVKSAKGNFDDPEEKERTGELKGKLFITRIGKETPELLDPPGVEFLGPVRCLVRVYVVEAFGLESVRRSGIIDPYLLVRCGKQKINLKKKYISDTLEPVFGEMIEMEVTIPLEKDLVVSIMDRRKILADEEIGSTTIDLENRLLTKWRATVGLASQYTLHGEFGWRDQLTPLATLKRYCVKMLLPAPSVIRSESDIGLKVLGVEFWHKDIMNIMKRDDEKFVGDSMRQSAGTDEKKEEKEKESNKKAESPGKISSATKKIFTLSTAFKKPVPDPPTKEDLLETRRYQRERIIGRPLQTVALYILNSMNLVPEHVETRALHTVLGGNRQSGEVRMFVDILPMSLGSIPAALDISPRKPDQYQLRLAVFNVSNAIPIRRSFGEPMSDLYVKVFVNGMQKVDKTDVHYRSLDGCGEFNWRFILNIDFNPWERKIVAHRKTRMFRKPRDEMVEPLLIIQLWDKNKFKKDVKLGEMELDITDFKEGVAHPDKMGMYTRRGRFKRCPKCCSRKCCLIRCTCFCIHTRCCFKIRKTEKKPYPRAPIFHDPGDSVESVSLFDTEVIRGWWPVLSDNPCKDATDEVALKKKNDDFDEDAMYVTGLVEMEMCLLPLEEAEADPLGRKRKEPNHSPYLAKPHRSIWNTFWLTSRVKPCLHWCWHKFGIQVLCWIIVILLLCAGIYALIINWPLILIALF